MLPASRPFTISRFFHFLSQDFSSAGSTLISIGCQPAKYLPHCKELSAMNYFLPEAQAERLASQWLYGNNKSPELANSVGKQSSAVTKGPSAVGIDGTPSSTANSNLMLGLLQFKLWLENAEIKASSRRVHLSRLKQVINFTVEIYEERDGLSSETISLGQLWQSFILHGKAG